MQDPTLKPIVRERDNKEDRLNAQIVDLLKDIYPLVDAVAGLKDSQLSDVDILSKITAKAMHRRVRLQHLLDELLNRIELLEQSLADMRGDTFSRRRSEISSRLSTYTGLHSSLMKAIADQTIACNSLRLKLLEVESAEAPQNTLEEWRRKWDSRARESRDSGKAEFAQKCVSVCDAALSMRFGSQRADSGDVTA